MLALFINVNIPFLNKKYLCFIGLCNENLILIHHRLLKIQACIYLLLWINSLLCQVSEWLNRFYQTLIFYRVGALKKYTVAIL